MLLKKGSSGEDVKKLQAKLGIKADGAFGPGTESNVKEWQASNGLTADGIVGDTTWSKMFGVNPQITDTVTQVEELSRIATQFGITNNLRLSHFLAQCAHESGAWKYKLEIASGKAYEGRKDLGNTQAGDGVRFKGRGYIQLTGRANYGVFSQFIGEDCVSQPELVATKYPLASAAFFFNRNKLWAICDQGATDEVITKVSKRVNGGTNGLADRLKKFKVYHDLLK